MPRGRYIYLREKIMKISILGSCVSRDVFNDAPLEDFTIEVYLARASLGSIFSEAPMRDLYSARITSPFQRRMVKADLAKDVAPQLLATQPDVILLDLIDERFHLMEACPGARFTLSVELRKVLGADAKRFRTISSGSAEFMRHWIDGWERLMSALDGRGLRQRLLVNKVFWQLQTEGGNKFDEDLCGQANEMLGRMYEHQAQDLLPNQFLEYGDRLSCPDSHQWGPAPFHFCDASHAFALARIREFSLAMGKS